MIIRPKIIALIIVVVLAIAGLGYYYLEYAGGNEGKTLIETDRLNILVTAHHSLTLSDGSEVSLTNQPKKGTLSFKYGDITVTGATMQLDVVMTTPAGKEPYDKVQFVWNNSNGIAPESLFGAPSRIDRYLGVYREIYWSVIGDITHVPQGWGTANPWMPSDKEKTVSLVSGTGNTVIALTPKLNFSTEFAKPSWDPTFPIPQTGTYTVKHQPHGIVAFRGISDTAGPGEWNTMDFMNNALTAKYNIEYIGNGVSVGWNTRVIWTLN